MVLAGHDGLSFTRRCRRRLGRLGPVFLVVVFLVVAGGDTVLEDRVEVGFDIVVVFVVIVCRGRRDGNVLVLVVFVAGVGCSGVAVGSEFFAILAILAVEFFVFRVEFAVFGEVLRWGILVSHGFLRLRF